MVARLQEKIEAFRQEACPILPAPDAHLEIFRVERLDQESGELRKQLDEFSQKVEGPYNIHLTRREEKIDEILKDGKTMTPESLFAALYEGVLYPKRGDDPASIAVPDIFVVLPADILALQLVQARARTESVDLNPVDMRAEQALEVARKYRRDWMNARASLVDSWRRLQFNADQLQAQLDVFMTGTMNNVNDNPFSLRANTGTLRAGVQFDTPLNRMSERNSYRQSLIEYQQARRNFYNFEDRIAQAMRGYLRQITAFQINFETNRLAVIEAARQVMLNTFIDQENQRTATSRVTAARDAVQGLTDLNNAQNQFMLTFITYEIARLQLDYNMGTMQLDNEGLWIDPGKMGQDYGKYDPWVWRNTPGSIGEGTTDNDPGELDRKIDELPPPFLLPTPDREPLPPAEMNQPRPPIGRSRER